MCSDPIGGVYSPPPIDPPLIAGMGLICSGMNIAEGAGVDRPSVCPKDNWCKEYVQTFAKIVREQQPAVL